MREKLIRRHKERDLKKQGHRACKGIGRLVVVLTVVGAEDHHSLVAREGLFDMRDTAGQLGIRIASLLLHSVCASVERQDEYVHYKAENYDRQTRMIDYSVCYLIYKLKQQLQRSYGQRA